MPGPPAAFLSYVRNEDEYDEGRITELRKRLEAEIRLYTGQDFTIFYDRQIGWGQAWQERIDQALDASTFFIPVLTRRFFTSEACRDELTKFLGREQQLGRNDLILPIYYVDAPVMNDPSQRAKDRLAQVLAARQYTDWRPLRLESHSDPRVRRLLSTMAQRVVAALEPPVDGPAVEPLPAPAAAATPAQPKQLDGPAQRDFAGTKEKLDMEQHDAPAEPLPQNEPPTHIVDPENPDRFPTVTAAIDAARPGDRIHERQ